MSDYKETLEETFERLIAQCESIEDFEILKGVCEDYSYNCAEAIKDFEND